MKVDTVTDFVKELSKDVGELSETQTQTKEKVESMSIEVKEIHVMLKQLFGKNPTAKGNKEGGDYADGNKDGDNAEANKEGDREQK